jgi:membrane protein DedA with SNARE-associated domain
MHIDVIGWLQGLSPVIIYGAVLVVVGVESLGVPLPGEIVLMSAALLASQGYIDPSIVWVAGAAGAIIGDSIGYSLGHHYGYKLLDRLAQWFPHHINTRTISLAQKVFHLHGIKVVFLGRFIAILRIFAGPLSGILKLPYPKFLLANALGGIVWSGLAVWAVYFLGIVAEHWFKRLSWIALGMALIIGTVVSLIFRRRMNEYLEKEDHHH